jgi:hypothetical protein
MLPGLTNTRMGSRLTMPGTTEGRRWIGDDGLREGRTRMGSRLTMLGTTEGGGESI